MKAKTILVSLIGILALYGAALAEWTEPIPVTEVNSEYADWTPFLSFDGLTLYFARGRTSSYYYFRIFEATREEPYGPFTSVSEVLSSNNQHVFSPWVSPDNLRMYYFAQKESPALWQFKVSERASVNDPWPLGSNISELNILGKPHIPKLTADELSLFFASYNIPGGQGGYDMWMATRPDRNSPFDAVTNLVGINTTANEVCPSVSPDGLTLIFQSNRNGDWQLFKATRESLNQPFGNTEQMPILEIPGYTNQHPSLSSDGSVLHFIRQLGDDMSTGDIYVSYWIEDPYGLAIIRIEDAIAEKLDALDKINAALEKEWTAYEALTELLESGEYGDLKKSDITKAMQKIHSSIQHEEFTKKALDRSIEKLEDALAALGWEPPPPVSYWTFDEGQGNIAYDSVGNNHGTIYGATWTTGQFNDALSFDGVDDYVEVVDDASLDFTTVYAGTWINTSSNDIGAVVNKRDEKINVDWRGFVLFVEAGYVRFGVDDGPNNSYTPISGTKIDDGQWHYISAQFDGESVTTYVDGIENTEADASSVTGNLNNDDELRIGAQWDGSSKYVHLFDGTIDEIRIWNRALSGEEIKQLYHNDLAEW